MPNPPKREEDAPFLPLEENEGEPEEVFSEDLQKELEAKFDELFGPMEEDNGNEE